MAQGSIIRGGGPRVSPLGSWPGSRRDVGVLRRIVRPQIRLADVVNHVVLLLRHHPGLRRHQAEAVRQRLIHRERIAAVLELVRRKPQRRGQRARLLVRAVAVDAEPVVNRLAALERLFIEVADHAGVVDVRLIFRNRSAMSAAGGRIRGPVAAAVAHLDEVPHEIQKLLPAGELIDQPGGHRRCVCPLAA